MRALRLVFVGKIARPARYHFALVREHGGDLFNRHGLSVIPALAFCAAQCVQFFDQRLVFNAFGCDRNRQAGTKAGNGADNRGAFGVFQHSRHKTAVDFDAVKGQGAQMCQ